MIRTRGFPTVYSTIDHHIMPQSNSDHLHPVTRAEFSIQDSKYPFIGASQAEGCTFELAEMVPRQDGRYAEFFHVAGADPSRVIVSAEEYETIDATLLEEHDLGGLVEFVVSGDCPAMTLAEHGALPREVQSIHGEGHIIAEIPQPYDASTVIEEFLEENPGAELVSKTEIDSFTPLFSNMSFEQILQTHLTDRQREVLRAAFDAGYYDWPRGCTGEEVAADLGITSATFSEHIHAAERNLFTIILTDSLQAQ